MLCPSHHCEKSLVHLETDLGAVALENSSARKQAMSYGRCGHHKKDSEKCLWGPITMMTKEQERIRCLPGRFGKQHLAAQNLPGNSLGHGKAQNACTSLFRVPPDVGLAPSDVWRGILLHRPCALGPLPPASLGHPPPQHRQKRQGGVGRRGRG